MEQGPDAQVDALEGAEGALDLGERLVGPHRPGIAEGRRAQVRAHYVEAVERRLGRDRGRVALEAERLVRDRQREVLGHLVAAYEPPPGGPPRLPAPPGAPRW